MEISAAEVKNVEKQARIDSLDPVKPFKEWSVEDYPHLLPWRKELISKMLELAPGARSSMQKGMEDSSWERRSYDSRTARENGRAIDSFQLASHLASRASRSADDNEPVC